MNMITLLFVKLISYTNLYTKEWPKRDQDQDHLF